LNFAQQNRLAKFKIEPNGQQSKLTPWAVLPLVNKLIIGQNITKA
jgi:hypothetical protein